MKIYINKKNEENIKNNKYERNSRQEFNFLKTQKDFIKLVIENTDHVFEEVKNGKYHIHHIVMISTEEGTNEISNLIALPRRTHEILRGKEKQLDSKEKVFDFIFKNIEVSKLNAKEITKADLHTFWEEREKISKLKDRARMNVNEDNFNKIMKELKDLMPEEEFNEFKSMKKLTRESRIIRKAKQELSLKTSISSVVKNCLILSRYLPISEVIEIAKKYFPQTKEFISLNV